MKYPIAFAIIAAAAAAAAIAGPRPVTLTANSQRGPCPNAGQVHGVDQRRDNYLSVRAGPGVRERELDRLRNGTMVLICDRAANGAWLGVVYSRLADIDTGDCLIAQTQSGRWPYRGLCRSGWVSARYLRVTAR